MMLLELMPTKKAQCQDHLQRVVEGMPSSEEEVQAVSSQLDASRHSSQMHCFSNSVVQYDCKWTWNYRETHRPTPVSVGAFATNRRASSASQLHRQHPRL